MYRDLTCYVTQNSALGCATPVGFRMYLKLFGVGKYHTDCFLRQPNWHWSICHRMIFREEGNIPRIQRSMNNVPTITSTARFLTTPNKVRTSRSSMRTMSGPIESTDTALQLSVRNGGDFIVFIDLLNAGGRKSIFTKFGMVPISIRLTTVTLLFTKYRRITGPNTSPRERMKQRCMDHSPLYTHGVRSYWRWCSRLLICWSIYFICAFNVRLCCCDAFPMRKGFCWQLALCHFWWDLMKREVYRCEAFCFLVFCLQNFAGSWVSDA